MDALAEKMGRMQSHPGWHGMCAVVEIRGEDRRFTGSPPLSSEGMLHRIENGLPNAQGSALTAELIVYKAFFESESDVPRRLARSVPDLYLDPQCDELKPLTVWSMSNAFRFAFSIWTDSAVPGNGKTRRTSGRALLLLAGLRNTELTPFRRQDVEFGTGAHIPWFGRAER